MSQIKLKHSGGNSVIIAAPSSNPASDRTLTLPGDADGTILTSNTATGKILQVKQTVRTSTASTGGTSFTKVADLSSTITTTGSNKVLVRVFIHFGTDGGNVVQFRLARTTTGSSENDELLIGNTASSRTRATMGGLAANANWEINPDSIEFLDSPGAGTHEYYIKWRVGSGSGTAYLNRSQRDLDNGSATRVPSVITTMEVAA